MRFFILFPDFVRFLFINGRIIFNRPNIIVDIIDIVTIILVSTTIVSDKKTSLSKVLVMYDTNSIGASVSIPQSVPIEYKNSRLSLRDNQYVVIINTNDTIITVKKLMRSRCTRSYDI